MDAQNWNILSVMLRTLPMLNTAILFSKGRILTCVNYGLLVVIIFVYSLSPAQYYDVHLPLERGICTTDFGGSPVIYNIQHL